MHNSPDNDPLAGIWQTQQTLKIDSQQVAKQAKEQVYKQRFYIFLDFLSLSPFALLFLIDFTFPTFLKVLTAIVFIAGLSMVIYFTKLRWNAAFAQTQTTADYLTVLIKQYENNALIARINKHSAWISCIVSVVAMALTLHFSERTWEERGLRVVIISIIMIVLLAAWYIWADKRQQRFKDQADRLREVDMRP
jgi:hypothetical protein